MQKLDYDAKELASELKVYAAQRYTAYLSCLDVVGVIHCVLKAPIDARVLLRGHYLLIVTKLFDIS